jgi:hypothetical protein
MRGFVSFLARVLRQEFLRPDSQVHGFTKEILLGAGIPANLGGNKPLPQGVDQGATAGRAGRHDDIRLENQ